MCYDEGMTAKELIGELEKCPPNATIAIGEPEPGRVELMRCADSPDIAVIHVPLVIRSMSWSAEDPAESEPVAQVGDVLTIGRKPAPSVS
jgi:hypothetical protein